MKPKIHYNGTLIYSEVKKLYKKMIIEELKKNYRKLLTKQAKRWNQN